MERKKKELKEMTPKEKRIFILVVIIIVVVIIFLIPKNESEELTNSIKKTYSNIEAYSASQQFVKEQLKAPSTAKFTYDPSTITKINDSTFYVIAIVDAENSFGAKIRNRYSCKIIFLTHSNQIRCEELNIK